MARAEEWGYGAGVCECKHKSSTSAGMNFTPLASLRKLGFIHYLMKGGRMKGGRGNLKHMTWQGRRLRALTPCSGSVRQRPWKCSDGPSGPHHQQVKVLSQDTKVKRIRGRGCRQLARGLCFMLFTTPGPHLSLLFHTLVTCTATSGARPLFLHPVWPRLSISNSSQQMPTLSSAKHFVNKQEGFRVGSGRGRYRNSKTEPVLKGMARC